MELSRLLRRGLLVVAVAIAGWVLSAFFATSASAEETPGGTPSQGLLGGLLGGVTNTLSGLTGTVANITGTVVDTTVDTATSVLKPPPQPEPILELPQLLPAPDDAVAAEPPVVTPAPAPPAPVVPAPVVAPEPVVVSAPRPEPAPVIAQAPPPAPVVRADDTQADEHTGQHVPEPQPVKAPATPTSPASTASPSHDNSGGARGTLGVLPADAILHPADAGFTTRSRAADAAGRDAGLPAVSPD